MQYNFNGPWTSVRDQLDADYRFERELVIERRTAEIIAQRIAQQNADALEHGDPPIPYDDADWHCTARAQAERDVAP